MFSNLEIRILVCKRDIQMCLNMVNSLRRYEEFNNIPIFFHSDGSLDVESKNILIELGNIYIIEKEYADNKILEYIDNYKNCKRYRFEKNRLFNLTKMKLFDFYFLSESKNILCIDSDVLFMNRPTHLIDLINTTTPFYFPDFQNAYSFCKTTQTTVLDKVNVGIFYIPSQEYYDIESIEFALNDLFTIGMTNGDWIEQSAWSYMYYKNGSYVSLDNKKYQIPNSHQPTPSDIEALHFVGHPPIRKLYDGFLKREYL